MVHRYKGADNDLNIISCILRIFYFELFVGGNFFEGKQDCGMINLRFFGQPQNLGKFLPRENFMFYGICHTL